MGEDIILCQREIRRLRCVVRTYEAQLREMESYLGADGRKSAVWG
jgi:hypothetical protein